MATQGCSLAPVEAVGFFLEDNSGTCACGNGGVNRLLNGRSVVGLSVPSCAKIGDREIRGISGTSR
jgi:hypothetical protein